MNFLFLVSAIISLGIVGLLLVQFFRLRKKELLFQIVSYLSTVGILYFLIAIFSFLWLFNFSEFSVGDFLIIYSFVILIQSIVFFRIISLISQNKKILYFLLFYFTIFVSVFYSWTLFFNLLILISFLLCFLFLMDLSLRSDLYNKVGYIGIFYSILGVLFQILYILGFGNLFLFSTLLEFVFFFLVFNLLKDLNLNPPVPEKVVSFKKKPYLFQIFGHLVFIIVLVNLVFIGTIAIHEFGHFSVSKLVGCEAGEIVYKSGYFHTEVLCPDSSRNIWVILGGVLIPFIVAFFLFFSGGKFVKDLAILIIGFNFISVSRDLADLGLSENIVLFSIFLGALFFIWGMIILTRSKVEDDIYLLFSDLKHNLN